MPLPPTFLWGAATSSYQIEGAVNEDGRGETIWDRFCHTLPPKIDNHDTGDVACDHYHRYRDDVALMRELGLQAYRFSVAWARVLPQGTGAVNAAGLGFYDRLVDELLAANIQPFVTLYHWDLPQALQDRGGWANRDSIAWFTEYADVVSRKLGDRVQHWMTHNEPFVAAFVGYYHAGHPPGLADLTTAYQVAHHLLLSHGAAAPVIRRNAAQASVGVALDLHPMHPASEQPEDLAAARRQDGFHNRWFLDPLFKGVYPEDMVDLLREWLPPIDLSEVKIAATLDFLGVNYYIRNVLQADESRLPTRVRHILPDGAAVTALNWEIYPQGLTELLLRLTADYAPRSIYITENGAAFNDPPPHNGVVDDPERVAYLDAHLAAVEQAVDRGAPVHGYFVWSLLDNFEWTFGYNKRFGIVYVEPQTLNRIPKRSAWYYRNRILQTSAPTL